MTTQYSPVVKDILSSPRAPVCLYSEFMKLNGESLLCIQIKKFLAFVCSRSCKLEAVCNYLFFLLEAWRFHSKVALCMTAQTTLHTQIWTEAINWGISYELPNNASEIRDFTYPGQMIQRRHRRDLYQKMETIMNSMGFDGRACVFRALCEASRTLVSKGNSIVEGLLRVVFKFPLERLMRFESEEHRLYHRAYRRGLDSDSECEEMFPGCSFSLIDVALGAYSNFEEDVPAYADSKSDSE